MVMSAVLSENQAYFAKIAGSYDQQFADAMTKLQDQIRGKAGFIGVKQGDRFLDYACGTGLLSKALSDLVGEAIGIDATESMVEVYNSRVGKEDGLPAGASAYAGNVSEPSDPAPAALSDDKFFNFDVAGVSTAWHHFENCELVAQRLAQRLRPGGVFFVVDFVAYEPTADVAGRGITQHGFTQSEIRKQFEAAGLDEGFAFVELEEPFVLSSVHKGVHDHGHGHGHGHRHGHDHGHSHDQRGEDHDHVPVTISRKVFVARGARR